MGLYQVPTEDKNFMYNMASEGYGWNRRLRSMRFICRTFTNNRYVIKIAKANLFIIRYVYYFGCKLNGTSHDNVTEWKLFPHVWSIAVGIHCPPVNSPRKGSIMHNFVFFFVVSLQKHRVDMTPMWHHCDVILRNMLLVHDYWQNVVKHTEHIGLPLFLATIL